ncbi:hypothetical protein TCAL_04263 [Tigriopus californicus]|uniref:Uncharacterized protein n=1 Tax=Tigriopus californicus TaxID=6832 RepID=A0A553PKI1_TIGCA|nr:hypothetical protein TCAL_04263 [Tigriopus californicus]
MEAERIAKSLTIYHQKYRASIAKRQSVSLATNLASTSGAEATQNGQHKNGGLQNGGGGPERKISSELFRKVVPGKCSDGKVVELNNLNDYSSQQVKGEILEYETSFTLKSIQLCPGCQGGEQDNPKIVSSAVGNMVEKWENSARILDQMLQNTNGEELSETDRVFASLNRCTSFEDLIPHGYDKSELNEDGFIDTINEGTEKVTLHGQALSRLLSDHKDVRSLMILLSSMHLAQNRIQLYNEKFQHSAQPEPFKKSLLELREIIEAINSQIFEYQSVLINTTVIHDAESQDWTAARPFYEGTRISVAVQFWGFHLQILRSDLFNILPPKVAQSLLAKIFDGSLSLLAGRYCKINPSPARLAQYRADITAILLITHDIMLSLFPGIQMFLDTRSNVLARSIHAKAAILCTALTLVGCPMKAMARVTLQGSNLDLADSTNRLQPLDKNLEDNRRLIYWLHLILPGYYSNVPEKLGTPAFVYLLGRMNALQPGPNWPLLVRLCLARNMEFCGVVLQNFGAFIPGITGEPFVKSMKEGCGKLMCTKRCLGTADIFWPQAVASGILYVVMHGNPDKTGLTQVLEPLLRRLSPNSWDVLHVNVMWNVKKPVWFQGLLDLIEPFFHPIIDDLLDDVESGRTWMLSQVPEAIAKLNTNILDVAYLIPPSFYQVCELIESLLPDNIRPLCDSVVVHIFISCIYGIITKLIPIFREWRMQREKLDFLTAVGEKLCNLNASTKEMQKLEGLTDSSSTAKTEKNHRWDDSPEEFVEIISRMVADSLLTDPFGQESLKAVYRFVSYNSEWLHTTLGVNAMVVTSSNGTSATNNSTTTPNTTITTTTTTTSPPTNNIKSHIKYSWLFAQYQHSWEDNLRFVSTKPSPLIVRLLKKRPEFQHPGQIEQTDKLLFEDVYRQLQRSVRERTTLLDR